MSDKTTYTDGVLEVELDGKTYELISSAKAMRTINANLGGFQAAYAALSSGNVEALEQTLKAGLTRREGEGIDEKIYRTGAVNLFLPAIKFVLMVNNGGKHPDNEPEVVEEERPTTRKTKGQTDPT